MPEEALTSFTVYDAYSYICASGIVIEVGKYVTHRISNTNE